MQHDLPGLAGVPEDRSDRAVGSYLTHWEPTPFAFVNLVPLFAEWLGVTEAEFRVLSDAHQEDL